MKKNVVEERIVHVKQVNIKTQWRGRMTVTRVINKDEKLNSNLKDREKKRAHAAFESFQ